MWRLALKTKTTTRARAPTSRAAVMSHSIGWLVAGRGRACHPAVLPRPVAPPHCGQMVGMGKAPWAGAGVDSVGDKGCGAGGKG